MTKLLSKRKLIAYLLLHCFHSVFSQEVKTIAGTGIQGFNGDKRSAQISMLNCPWGIAQDRYGNLYIADYANSRIRKISASNGLITTIAGTGKNGYNGDGFDAINAQLNAPMGVAIDTSGNIYIADDGNYRIRKINIKSGKISTVAGTGTQGFSGDGGPATSAQLGDPWHISFDAANNMYITDYSNSRIRKINAVDGIINTVAGNGSIEYNGDGGSAINASLNYPVATAIDTSGNIYIADHFNNRIRKVSIKSGTINTIAGNGDYGFNSDNIPATKAQLALPGGVAVDDSGNVYIADSDNNRIRKVNATNGKITTITGGKDTSSNKTILKGPQAILLSLGNLYFTDTYNGCVRSVPNAYKESPVKFVYFTAKPLSYLIKLDWAINKASFCSFTIQTSDNSINWSDLKSVSMRDSTGANTYANTIALPQAAIGFYRIMAVSSFNDTVYSNIQKIEVIQQFGVALSVYPNPVKESFIIRTGNPILSKIGYAIINMAGKAVQSGTITNNIQSVNISRLPSGIYLLKLTDGRTIKISKTN